MSTETVAANPAKEVCPHVQLCSGCPCMGTPYDEQLAFKHKRVADPIGRYAVLGAAAVEPVIASDLRLGYRTRAKLMVDSGGTIGLFARGGGHQVVDVPGCRVITPLLSQVVAKLRAALLDGSLGLEAGRQLVAIDVREAQADAGPQVLLTLVVQRDRRPADAVLRDAGRWAMREIEAVRGVAINLREPGSVQVLGRETLLVAGTAVLPDKLGEVRHHATFGAFTQINRGQASRVQAMLTEQMKQVMAGRGSPSVLELYGGAGAIGIALARAGARVEMMESFAPAVHRATQAAAEQGLEGRYHATVGDAATGTRDLVQAGRTFDILVANPPRRGMSPAARRWASRAGLQAMGYVSCDPDTLARDLADLAVRGLRPARIRPLDMIPQTEEVETLAWLERAAPPSPTRLLDHPHLLALDKPPHESVTPHDARDSSLLGRLRSEPGLEGCWPLGRLEREASGIVVFARSAQDASDLASVTEDPDTREEFLVLCVGRVPAKGRRVGAWHRVAVLGGHSLIRLTRSGMGNEPVASALAVAGLRVVGDRRHGHRPTNSFFEERHALDRAFVHRARVQFAHARLERVIRVDAPLAGDLATTLIRLGGEGTLDRLKLSVHTPVPPPEPPPA